MLSSVVYSKYPHVTGIFLKYNKLPILSCFITLKLYLYSRDRTRPPRTMDIFDEKLHPLTVRTVPYM